MATPSLLQLLNFAVDCLEPEEVYCEVGCFQGASLIGALLNHPERLAYAVDDFSEFDPFETNLAQLSDNLAQFGIDGQVLFCFQSFADFFHDLATVEDRKPIGLYFYDAASDYRSQLLGLLLVKPFLAERALIVCANRNSEATQQAIWDFMSAHPQCKLLFDLPTQSFAHSTFWNGLQVLSWDRHCTESYPSETLKQARQESFLRAMQALEMQDRQQIIQRLKAEATEAIAHYNSTYLQEYGQYPEIVNWVRKPLLQAEARYHEVLHWNPLDLDAYYSLGTIYAEQEQYEKALEMLLQALKLSESQAVIYGELARVYEKLQNYAQAIQHYQKAIELDPTFIPAYEYLGQLLIQLGEVTQAESVYRQAIAANPENVNTQLGSGNCFIKQQQFDAAIAAYQKALSLQSTHADALQGLGTAWAAKGESQQASFYLAEAALYRKNFEEAIQQYNRYLEQHPHPETIAAQTYLNLAEAYRGAGQNRAAVEVYQRAIQYHPNNELLHIARIIGLQDSGYTQAAIAAAQEAAHQFPTNPALQFEQWRTFPILYTSSAEIDHYRERFTRGLAELIQNTRLDTPTAVWQALMGTWWRTNFYLQYQCCNDKSLQMQYGEYVHRVMAANYPHWMQPLSMPALEGNGKIRVGYVSSFFREHVVARMTAGWLRQSDRQQFEIYTYHTGEVADHVTRQLSLYSDRFYHIPKNLEAVCQQIRADNLHILVFADVGMEPLTTQMAALRLAPVQCSGWGHPITTGLPTIDYYLSSEQMEPEQGQEHYSEILIPLPNTGLCYTQPDIPPFPHTRQDFGLHDDAIVYLSSQSLFKYLPQYDSVFAEIARQVPQAQFAFLVSQNSTQVTEQFQQRLKQAFATVGLNSEDFCVMIPRQNQLGFWGLNSVSDVMLDTFGWSGGNTVFDAIACGLPVVTCPGEFMRGRHAYGILKTMGVTETIAANETEFVAIAVRLGLDLDYRATIRQKVQQHRSRLFEDKTCVDALETFYRQVVQEKIAANSSAPEDSQQTIQQTIQQLKAEAMEAIAQYESIHLKEYGQYHQIVNWVREPLLKAEQKYREVLSLNPQDIDALFNLGTIYSEIERYPEALDMLSQALKLNQFQAEISIELGMLFEKMGEMQQAIQTYQTAIQTDAANLQAYERLGQCLLQSGELAQAEAIYRQEIVANPGSAGGYVGLGNVLTQQGQPDEAIAAYQTALSLKPADPDALQGLGTAYEAKNDPEQASLFLADAALFRGDYPEAVTQYRRYFQLQSNLGAIADSVFINLANAYRFQAQNRLAAEVCLQGLQYHPNNETLHLYRITSLQNAGYTLEAIGAAREAIAQFPNHPTWEFEQWRTLPLLYNTASEIEYYRDRFTQGLTNLIQQMDLQTPEHQKQALKGLQWRTNFYLQYQCRNDRELQTRYGEYVHQVMAANYPQWAGNRRTTPSPSTPHPTKIRIGFLSAHLRNHNGARWALGWIKPMNRQQFEIYSYHTGQVADQITRQFQWYSDRFYHFPNDLEAVCQQIEADQLHILIFTDIGMDPLTSQIAGLRLAPVQCTAWGHPITSGLPTIDYYLSSDLMEPVNAQEHYSETLVRLPNTGLCYARPQVPPLPHTRKNFGLRQDAVVYLSPQSLFKYLPQYDHIFADIACQVPQAQFAFIASSDRDLVEQFRQRLSRAFATRGLNSSDYCVIVPRQNQLGFWGLNSVSDVLIDTFGWGGGNTVFEAIACGLPVLTCPGEFMRGRHAYAILKTMGMTEMIAHDENAFVAIAVKLGLDPEYRAQIRQQQQERSDLIYNDLTCVRALEKFFCQIVQK
ncbi:tetratricopeptide repeat protein [Leptothermofonsia sp. ETS-13]|uniref:O-linked N-acetylglucosamine transferase family protein n=1 Tax=Leptothermofonsia sp. ETS-13 TaxID=3035696 RepID=UPI003BA3B450